MRGAAAVVPQDVAAPPMEPMDSMDQFATPTPGNPLATEVQLPTWGGPRLARK